MKVVDPVCGMTIEDKDAVSTSTLEGKTYSFCSLSCKEKFEKNPRAYTGDRGGEANNPMPAPMNIPGARDPVIRVSRRGLAIDTIFFSFFSVMPMGTMITAFVHVPAWFDFFDGLFTSGERMS
jgi:YHS domain-containing protein